MAIVRCAEQIERFEQIHSSSCTDFIRFRWLRIDLRVYGIHIRFYQVKESIGGHACAWTRLGEWLPLFVECSYTASVNATDTFNPMSMFWSSNHSNPFDTLEISGLWTGAMTALLCWDLSLASRSDVFCNLAVATNKRTPESTFSSI